MMNRLGVFADPLQFHSDDSSGSHAVGYLQGLVGSVQGRAGQGGYTVLPVMVW